MRFIDDAGVCEGVEIGMRNDLLLRSRLWPTPASRRSVSVLEDAMGVVGADDELPMLSDKRLYGTDGEVEGTGVLNEASEAVREREGSLEGRTDRNGDGVTDLRRGDSYKA